MSQSLDADMIVLSMDGVTLGWKPIRGPSLGQEMASKTGLDHPVMQTGFSPLALVPFHCWLETLQAIACTLAQVHSSVDQPVRTLHPLTPPQPIYAVMDAFFLVQKNWK